MANSVSSFVIPNEEPPVVEAHASRFTPKFHRCLGHVRAANAKRGTTYEEYGVCTASIGYAGSYTAGHRRGARTPAGRARKMREYNTCHDPEDGRFCSGDQRGSQHPQTQTAAFRRWFEGSVVTNPDGSPKVLYHATNWDVEEFRPFTHVGTAQAANDRYAALIAMDDWINGTTGSNRRPTDYRMYPVYVAMKNPLRMPDLASIDSSSGRLLAEIQEEMDDPDYDGSGHGYPRGWEGEEAIATTLLEMGIFTIDDFEEARSNRKALLKLRRMGYDGIVYQNDVEDPGSDSYIVFSPRQIKSVSGSKGTFSRRRRISESALRESHQQRMAERFGVTQFEFPSPDSTIRHMGYSPSRRKWYGWSHRAVAGFGVGSTVRKGDVIADTSEFAGPTSLPVGFTAKTLADARRMAAAFAMAVA